MPNIEKHVRQISYRLEDETDIHDVFMFVFAAYVPGRIFGFKVTIKGICDANASYLDGLGEVALHTRPFAFNWALTKNTPQDNIGLNEPYGAAPTPEQSFMNKPKQMILGGQWLGNLVMPRTTFYYVPPVHGSFTEGTRGIEQNFIVTTIAAGTVQVNPLLPNIIGNAAGDFTIPAHDISRLNYPTEENSVQECHYEKLDIKEKSRTGRMMALNDELLMNFNFNRQNHAIISIFIQFFFEKQ